MRFIPLHFSEKIDALAIGKKAYILNKLNRNSYPVLEGFILSPQVFKEFIITGEIKEQVFSLLKAKKFEELRILISNHEFPADLREEIMGHCAGLGDTYSLAASSSFESDIGFFNIKQEQVLDWIKKCWASVFNSQNTSLGRTNMFPAVVVQKHLDIEKSGNLYTINPAERDKTKIIIEVSTPQRYFFVASKQSLKVINEKDFRNLNSPLFIDEMDHLLKLGISIEKSFKKPQKISWIFNEKFYVIDTRRINDEDISYFQKLKRLVAPEAN